MVVSLPSTRQCQHKLVFKRDMAANDALREEVDYVTTNL